MLIRGFKSAIGIELLTIHDNGTIQKFQDNYLTNLENESLKVNEFGDDDLLSVDEFIKKNR